MKTRLIQFAALALIVALGMAADVQAAHSRDKLPKGKPAEGQAKAQPAPPPAVKSAGNTDDFKDRDNNGVDDRHEKKAIRPEPAPTPVLKEKPKGEAAPAAKEAGQKATPPATKPEEPPAAKPPGR